MFRRLMLVSFVIIVAAFARQAAAQRPVYLGNLEKILGPGYTEQQLIAEKRLLLKKSRPITWDCLPLVQFPRARKLLGSQEYWAQFGIYKPPEAPASKFEEARKRFVETKLKDRTFSGTVRIGRKEQKGQEYTIYSNEPARPRLTVNYQPPSFAANWPPYICQWQSASGLGFKVGETIEILGKIVDLKEECQEEVQVNTLFLKDVEIVKKMARDEAE